MREPSPPRPMNLHQMNTEVFQFNPISTFFPHSFPLLVLVE